MIIEVLLFAAARELTGNDAVKVEVALARQDGDVEYHVSSIAEKQNLGGENLNCVTVGCILQALTQQYPELQPLLPSCRIAVDCEYVGSEASVSPEAEVALIPPVSGG